MRVARLEEDRWSILFKPGESMVVDSKSLESQLSGTNCSLSMTLAMKVGTARDIAKVQVGEKKEARAKTNSALAVSNVEGWGTKVE